MNDTSEPVDQQHETVINHEPQTAPRTESPRRQRLKLLVASAIVAIGLLLVFRGVMEGVTGKDRARYPDVVESVTPVPDAVQAFSHDTVIVDLATGYTGELTIDGIPIETVAIGEYANPNAQPGDQIDLPPVTIYEPGNATLTFVPSASAPIEEFSVGQHTVIVTYWKVIDGREHTRTYTWIFNVV